MNTEIDPVIRNCIKLLHSDSKLKLRTALDEIIKQKYGPNKILSNIFGRKYLNEESSPPPTTVSVSSSSSVAGIGGTIKRHKSDDSSSSSSERTTSSPIPIITTSTSHDIISKTFSGGTGNNNNNNNNDNDGTAGSGRVSLSINLSDMKTIDVTGEEENLTKDFGDLACVVCGQMVVTAGNRLIECTECHSLYHQECHKPCISDIDANEQEFSWCCSNCKNKLVFGSSVGVNSSSGAGSGNNNMIISSGKTLISDAGGSIEIIPSSLSTSKSTHSHSSSSSSSSSSTSSHYSSKHSTDHSGSKIRSKSSSKHDVLTSGTSSSSRGALESSNASASATITGGSSSSGGNGSSSKNNGNKITSSSGNNTTAPITPNINIVSADKRIENMKRKAVKQQESKKKHK